MADKDIKNEELAAMQEDAEEVQVVVLTDDNEYEAVAELYDQYCDEEE